MIWSAENLLTLYVYWTKELNALYWGNLLSEKGVYYLRKSKKWYTKVYIAQILKFENTILAWKEPLMFQNTCILLLKVKYRFNQNKPSEA